MGKRCRRLASDQDGEVTVTLDLDSLYRPGDDYPAFVRRVGEAYDWRLRRIRESWLEELILGMFTEPEWEDSDGTDAAGWPLFIYDRWFTRLVIGAGLACGCLLNVRDAALSFGLADRYCKRGQWICDILVEAFLQPDLPPVPDEAALQRFWNERQGLSARAVAQLAAGQAVLPLFADV